MTLHNSIILSLVMIASFSFCGCGNITSKTDTERTTSPGKTPNPPSRTASDSAIDTVKEGMLAGYDSTTVGKAFEGTFQRPKWTAFETPKGQTIVQFDGTISGLGTLTDAEWKKGASPLMAGWLGVEEIHNMWAGCAKSLRLQELDTPEADAKIRDCVHGTPVPAMFQFVLSADKKSFRLAYTEKRFGSPEQAIAFVYR
jgi:hypothetical protein